MMKRTSKVLAFLTIGAMLLAGCGQSTSSSTAASTAEQSEATASSTATEELSGKVSTGGSTSMEAVVGAFQEAFAEKYPGVDVTYDPTGSGAGITGAQEGSLDIGLSSRALKEDETGVTGTTIALDGIAIIVNSENPVADLTIEQLAGIAKGEITNWSEVGGEDAEIVFIGREAGRLLRILRRIDCYWRGHR